MTKKLFGLCLGAIAISGLLLVSCDNSETNGETVYSPTVTVSTSAITASSEGGSYSFTYTIANPADDGSVNVAADASWISGVSDTGGSVSFTAAENTTGDSRTGHISVAYSSSNGNVTKTVTVAQSSGAVPELTVQPTAVAADVDGGTYSFTYTITNPASDGELSCETDASWISGFDYSTSGKVSFTVAASTETSMREGVITAYYTYGSGELSETVTVVQDHTGGSGSGGGNGGGDISSVVGTYTAHGSVYGSGITTVTEMEWTVKIYDFNSQNDISGDYDGLYDGVIPWGEGCYDYYGDHRASAGIYVNSNGSISMPSQIANCKINTTSGGSYYLGYTPCVKYEDGQFYSSQELPDLTFTYNSSTGQYVSDYGVFMAGCTGTSISTMYSFFQVVIPTITLTKTSDSTAATSSLQNAKVAHPITEGLVPMMNFKAE